MVGKAVITEADCRRVASDVHEHLRGGRRVEMGMQSGDRPTGFSHSAYGDEIRSPEGAGRQVVLVGVGRPPGGGTSPVGSDGNDCT